ncbi:MAG: HEAT repeat domain-containing protein, partial [Planctomycetes bacterium]|nr:HEAT repeat domain-containing protein [Planctomycetota bacterium]
NVLAQAYEAYDEIDLEIVRPQLAAGHDYLWSTVASKEPAALLRAAADFEEISPQHANTLAMVLGDHGGPEDLPLALRLMERPLSANAWESIAGYMAVYGKGSKELLRLLARPQGLLRDGARHAQQLAHAAVSGAKVADLDAYLELMPRLGGFALQELVTALEGQVGETHVAPIGAAFERLRDGGWKVSGAGSASERGDLLAQQLVRLLRATAAPAAQRYLRMTLSEPRPSRQVTVSAVRALLAVAGDGRRELIAELLRSDSLLVAIQALDVPEIGSDDELQELARAVFVRSATESSAAEVVFRHLDREASVTLATAVLQHESMPSFDRDLMLAVLDVFAGSKDAAFVPQLQRGTKHRDDVVRGHAATLLGRTFTREAADALIELLRDDDHDVRKAADNALGMIANYLDKREQWEKRLRRK